MEFNSESLLRAKPQILARWSRLIEDGGESPLLAGRIAELFDQLSLPLNGAAVEIEKVRVFVDHCLGERPIGAAEILRLQGECQALQRATLELFAEVMTLEPSVVSAIANATIELGRAVTATLLVRSDQIHERTGDQFRLLVQEVKDFAIFLLDPEGHVATWNEGAERIKQYTAEEILGRHYRVLYRREDQEEGRPERNLKIAIENGRHEEQWWRVKKDGTMFWADAVHTAIRDSSGRLVGVAKTVRDLTDKKRADEELLRAKERAEAASQAKTTFLANMSHEIRTPLNAILGMVDLLDDESSDAREREVSREVIQRNAEVLTRLIEDLLDFSKIEAGKLTFEITEVPLRSLLTEVQGLHEERARGKGLRLELVMSPDLPDYVHSDAVRLRQVLNNLVGNAIKFTDHGQVRLEAKRRDEHRIEFLVKDSGPGIPTDKQDHLFSPFTQADNSVTRRYGGTGLGLALSRKLARELGGDIEIVDCPVNEGCTFRVTVKAMLGPVTKAVDTGVKDAAKIGSLEGISLLVADDSPDNRFLMARLLSKAGASVRFAEDGRQAVELATAETFDIVLMDIQMPELDGNTAIRLLRESGSRVPIIALTAHALLEERQKAFAAGCDDYLTKPLSKEKLFASIHKFAGSGRGRRQASPPEAFAR